MEPEIVIVKLMFERIAEIKSLIQWGFGGVLIIQFVIFYVLYRKIKEGKKEDD